MVDGGPAEADGRSEVVLVKGSEGTLSLELLPLEGGLARGFLRCSPRGLRLSEAQARHLSEELSERAYVKILAQDTRARVLARALMPQGWRVARAVEPVVRDRCFIVTTHDVPMDEVSLDDMNQKLDLRDTDHMHGLSIEFEGRKAWAFYSDEGDIARIVSEGPRRQGLLAARSAEDMQEAADCLIRFLAASKKRWAVFSVNMGRFVRQYHPITMWRMTLDRPVAYQHSAAPLSSANKRHTISLLSEYYDESALNARLRLGRLRSDNRFSVFLVDGGFVIVKLDGEIGLIYDIYVTPTRQGQGLGGELMRCALTHLVGRASSVILHTSYPRAKALYEKFGFRTTYSQLGVTLDEIELERPGAG